MRIFKAAGVAAAFCVVAVTAGLVGLVLSGGGYSSSRGEDLNTDTRSVLVELLFVVSEAPSTAGAGVTPESLGKLAALGGVLDEASKFDDVIALAEKAAADTGGAIRLQRVALLVQHGEEGAMEFVRNGVYSSIKVRPDVLETNGVRVAIEANAGSAPASSKESPDAVANTSSLATAFTTRSGGVCITKQQAPGSPAIVVAVRTTVHDAKAKTP